MMAVSQNGWGAAYQVGNTVRDVPPLTKLSWITGSVRSGDVWTVLNEVARRFNNEVEKINPAESWGYAPRPIRGSSTTLSNHASGTAVDFNAPRHPLGKVNTFNPAQRAAIRKILNDLGGVVRWGGDYTGRKDEMHFEINATPAAVAKVANAIRNNTGIAPPQKKDSFMSELTAAEQRALFNRIMGKDALSVQDDQNIYKAITRIDERAKYLEEQVKDPAKLSARVWGVKRPHPLTGRDLDMGSYVQAIPAEHAATRRFVEDLVKNLPGVDPEDAREALNKALGNGFTLTLNPALEAE
jgi:hypothetical protein